MKRIISVLLAFASVLALTAAQGDVTCNPDECPAPLCANPENREGECCPTCENSNCLYRGCVHFGAFGPQWRPDPCTICQCIDDREICTQIICDEPQCFGFPLKTDPDSCCPGCDWGIADDECAPIPVGTKSLYVAIGDNAQCHTDVTVHECDKNIVLKDGKTHECRPRKRGRPAPMRGCDGVRKVIYEDTKECRLVEADIADFDPNPESCQLRV